MSLLDRLKEHNEDKYISFWGLLSNIMDVDEERGDENYLTVAEALLRLRLHERVRYFIYDNFIFEQIDEFEINEAKVFLKALLPSNGKKLTPTEVVSIQRKFKNYFWLKESVKKILPESVVNFDDPRFLDTGEYQFLDVKPSDMENEELIELQQQNQDLREKISELETSQGYLDRDNKHFSVEMKICHDTWNHCYNKDKVSNLSNLTRVEKYLSTYPDFKVGSNAARRIATVINPKKALVDSK